MVTRQSSKRFRWKEELLSLSYIKISGRTNLRYTVCVNHHIKMGTLLEDYDKRVLVRNLLAFVDIILWILLLMKLANGEDPAYVIRTGILAGFFFVAFIVMFFVIKSGRCIPPSADEASTGGDSEEATLPLPFSSVAAHLPPPSPPLARFVPVEPSAPHPHSVRPSAASVRPPGPTPSGAAGRDSPPPAYSTVTATDGQPPPYSEALAAAGGGGGRPDR